MLSNDSITQVQLAVRQGRLNRYYLIGVFIMYIFQCQYCGSKELSYEKWIHSQEEVIIHENGLIEYKEPEIDENNTLGVEYGFVCKNCGHSVEHCGIQIQTEPELIAYLSMNLAIREKEEKEYLQIETQLAQEDERREKEINEYYEIYSHEISDPEDKSFSISKA